MNNSNRRIIQVVFLQVFALTMLLNVSQGQDQASFNTNFGSINNEKENLDLYYGVDTRYIHSVTKEQVDNAKSIIDLLPIEATKSIVKVNSTRVSILFNSRETDESVRGKNEILNDAQIKLLQATDYSTNFYIRADYKEKSSVTGKLLDNYLTYYISIVPEKAAEYTMGNKALISYLKEASREEASIIKADQLKPGKVTFAISKTGTIENVRLTSTSGYDSVDKELVRLISNMPGKWIPARNAKGEKVGQDFVFFFGLVGC